MTRNQGNPSSQATEKIALLAQFFPTEKARLSDILGSKSKHREAIEAFVECESVLRRLKGSSIADARKILEYQRIRDELRLEILNILDERARAGFEP